MVAGQTLGDYNMFNTDVLKQKCSMNAFGVASNAYFPGPYLSEQRHQPMKVEVSRWLTAHDQQMEPARIPMQVPRAPPMPFDLMLTLPQRDVLPLPPQRSRTPSDISVNSSESRFAAYPFRTPSPPASPEVGQLELGDAKTGYHDGPITAAQLAAEQGTGTNKWWTRSRTPLMCPLTHFPICLLPYPPFKLRVDPAKPSPLKLVDGKCLALRIIIEGQVAECGRELLEEDVAHLDAYIHRCKLGPFRPGRVLALAKEITESANPKDALQKGQELRRLRAAARAELGRLRRIQENRMLQLKQAQ